MSEHTPTPCAISPRPWGIRLSGASCREIIGIGDARWKVGKIATVHHVPADWGDGVANAEHIVRCVNAHEALVEALREVRDWVYSRRNGMGDRHFHPPFMDAVNIALASLEGEGVAP